MTWEQWLALPFAVVGALACLASGGVIVFVLLIYPAYLTLRRWFFRKPADGTPLSTNEQALFEQIADNYSKDKT